MKNLFVKSLFEAKIKTQESYMCSVPTDVVIYHLQKDVVEGFSVELGLRIVVERPNQELSKVYRELENIPYTSFIKVIIGDMKKAQSKQFLVLDVPDELIGIYLERTFNDLLEKNFHIEDFKNIKSKSE